MAWVIVIITVMVVIVAKIFLKKCQYYLFKKSSSHFIQTTQGVSNLKCTSRVAGECTRYEDQRCCIYCENPCEQYCNPKNYSELKKSLGCNQVK